MQTPSHGTPNDSLFEEELSSSLSTGLLYIRYVNASATDRRDGSTLWIYSWYQTYCASHKSASQLRGNAPLQYLVSGTQRLVLRSSDLAFRAFFSQQEHWR